MMDLKFLFKLCLCVIQLVLLFQVLMRDKIWPVPFQLLIAFVAMCM